MIKGFSPSQTTRQVDLKSITTMGSPILFLNMMLEVSSDKLKDFVNKNLKQPLRWRNIIHASDLIAYPLGASLNLNSSDNIFFRDEFISTDANLAEKAARAVGQLEAALALGVADAHSSYWHCPQTAHLITTTIWGTQEIITEIINRLDKVVGMTKTNMSQLSQNSPIDQTLEFLEFNDGSGSLHFVVNPVKVHHVYVFDNQDNYKFAGYVGWINTEGLKQEINSIKRTLCKLDSKTWMKMMKMRGI